MRGEPFIPSLFFPLLCTRNYPDSFTEQLLAPKKTSQVSEAALSQPCCTALQVALAKLLQTYGIRPESVVGHSSGEIAAAYACGSITLREAIIIAYYRGKVLLDIDPTIGSMAAVGLGKEAAEPYLVPGVRIGCENSPQSVTLTGDAVSVKAVVDRIKLDSPDTFARLLQVDRAYHSRKSLQSYRARLADGANIQKTIWKLARSSTQSSLSHTYVRAIRQFHSFLVSRDHSSLLDMSWVPRTGHRILSRRSNSQPPLARSLTLRRLAIFSWKSARIRLWLAPFARFSSPKEL